jgi:hypothetical protein
LQNRRSGFGQDELGPSLPPLNSNKKSDLESRVERPPTADCVEKVPKNRKRAHSIRSRNKKIKQKQWEKTRLSTDEISIFDFFNTIGDLLTAVPRSAAASMMANRKLENVTCPRFFGPVLAWEATILKRPQTLDRPDLENPIFSGHAGPVGVTRFCNMAGTLLPMALCGRCSF